MAERIFAAITVQIREGHIEIEELDWCALRPRCNDALEF